MKRFVIISLAAVAVAIFLMLCPQWMRPGQDSSQRTATCSTDGGYCDASMLVVRADADLDAVDSDHSVLIKDDEGKIRPITHADSLLVIYTDCWGFGGATWDGPRLILGIWPDGHIVWSADWVKGGPPHYTAEIDPKRLHVLLRKFERSGLFKDKNIAESHYGVDSPFTVIRVKSGELYLEICCGQEIVDSLPGGDPRVPTSDYVPYGEFPLDEKRRWSRSYLFYRMVWSEVRLSAASLIPHNGTPVRGRFVHKDGGACWQEKPVGSE